MPKTMTEETYTDVDHTQARELVAKVKENDLAILLQRIGAAPWLYHTPYTNNRDVQISMWSCISYQFRAMPEKTLLGHPTIIKPEEYDDWEIRMITDEWVIHQVALNRGVNLISKDESPFANDIVGPYNTQNND